MNFIALAAGYCHSLGLKADGSIVAWGRNTYGQCDVPAPNADFIALAAGQGHSLAIRGLTPVGMEPTAVPPTPALAGSFPNPFNPVTTVRFGVPVESRVSLRIYDLQGRVVRTLVDDLVPAGWHEMRWDVRQDAGHRLAGGIFFLRMHDDHEKARSDALRALGVVGRDGDIEPPPVPGTYTSFSW
jgi:hypothetical protein